MPGARLLDSLDEAFRGGLLKLLYLGFYLADFVHFSHVGVKFDTGYDGDILKSRGLARPAIYRSRLFTF